MVYVESLKSWRFLSLVVFLFVFSVPGAGLLSAIEWQALDVEFAATWQFNASLSDEAEGKQPSVIRFNPGAAVLGDYDGEPGGWYFRPGGWFSWGIENVYNGIARPAGEEKIDHMKVLGLMADFPWGYAITPGNTTIGFQGGPAAYLRFPLWTAQLGTAEPGEFWKAYYGKLQFFHISLASWAAFPVGENLEAFAGLRSYIPFSNIWAGTPFMHGFQLTLNLGLRFDFPLRKENSDD